MSFLLKYAAVFCLLVLLPTCSISKTASSATATIAEEEEMKDPLKLVFSGLERINKKLALAYILRNDGKDTLSILKPRPVVENNSFVPAAVPPEFFSLAISPTEALCEYAPMNSGTRNVKKISDFVILAPGDSHIFYINPDHFYADICNEEVLEVKVTFSYKFDERYLDRSFFDRTVTNPGRLSTTQSDKLFMLLKSSYQGDQETDAISLEVEAFMR